MFSCQITEEMPKSMSDLCQSVILGHNDSFPDINILAQIASTLIVSTVSVERGFSQQNLTKTRTRTGLLPQNLEKLVKIAIVGPAFEDINFHGAYDKWSNVVSRKLLNTH